MKIEIGKPEDKDSSVNVYLENNALGGVELWATDGKVTETVAILYPGGALHLIEGNLFKLKYDLSGVTNVGRGTGEEPGNTSNEHGEGHTVKEII